jgi:16S rRNA (uracil1498-N3)-methyltransferase
MVSFGEALEQMKQTDVPLMLYEQGGVRFSEAGLTNTGSVSILIGSEGGFDESEVLKADEAGIKRIWLGDRILRCETAPLVAVSLTMFLTGNL